MFGKGTKYARVFKLPKEQPEFPYKPATMYRWHHVGKFPEIFLRFNGTLFVDLEALYRLIEAGRTQRFAPAESCSGLSLENWTHRSLVGWPTSRTSS